MSANGALQPKRKAKIYTYRHIVITVSHIMCSYVLCVDVFN